MRVSLVVPLALQACATFALSGCALARATKNPIVPVVEAAPDLPVSKADGLPSNIDAAKTLHPILHVMWQRSRTFRAQCARIERAPSLQVVLTRARGTQAGEGGARAELTRSDRRVQAQIVVSLDVSSNALFELIAHELEHVIEQLDGVQLTGRAQTGVFRDASGRFETARATHIGQQVATEVRRPRNDLVLSLDQK
jgi:hypothetical protein